MQIRVLVHLLPDFLNLLHQKCKPCNKESHDKLLRKRVSRFRIYFMMWYTHINLLSLCVWATLASPRSSSEKLTGNFLMGAVSYLLTCAPIRGGDPTTTTPFDSSPLDMVFPNREIPDVSFLLFSSLPLSLCKDVWLTFILSGNE